MDIDAELDHRSVIARIPAAARRALATQSNAPGLARLGAHLGLVGALAVWVALGWPGWGVALVAEGVLLAFLFCAEHEAIHRTAFRNDWINVSVANLCGFLLLMPPVWFRHFHLAHHRFTHDPERDPELATPKPSTWVGYAWHVSGAPDWAARVRTLAANAARGTDAAFVPERGRAAVRAEARLFLAGYGLLAAGSVAAGSDLLLWVWVLPALAGQPFMRAYLLAEHARCPHVANMLENTRTTLTNRTVRLLAWNMPYHIEHHAYPAAPFHKLPTLHRLMREHLGTTERGYLRFNRRYLAAALDGSLAREGGA